MLSDRDKQEIRQKIDHLAEKENSLKKSLDKDRPPREKSARAGLKYAHIGFEFIGGFLLFFFLGLYLDNKFNGKSMILIAFIVIGFIISVVRLIQTAQKIE